MDAYVFVTKQSTPKGTHVVKGNTGVDVHPGKCRTTRFHPYNATSCNAAPTISSHGRAAARSELVTKHVYDQQGPVLPAALASMNDSEQAKGDVISHVLTRSPISNGASGSLSVLATGDRDSILVPQPFRRKDIYNLKDSGNPITHSKAYEKTQHIHSVASGHQRGGGSMNAAVRNAIQERLDAQSLADLQDVPGSKATRKIFAGLKVYVNGYTKGTTRSEIVKLVDLHGGYNLRTATGATHIITSMALSGTKTQKILTGISVKTKQYVVKPEWLFDSIDAGKRLNEFKYNIIDQSQVQSQLKWGKDPLPGSKD